MTLLPTDELDRLWPEWLELYARASTGRPGCVAAPFFSAADSRWMLHSHRFMILGQATKGSFYKERFDKQASVAKSLMDRKHVNREHIAAHRASSKFWCAFRYGSGLSPCQNFTNAVWSNIAKLGFAERNIDSSLMDLQEELALRTLKCELDTYRPTLVHFATGQIGDKCILGATQSSAGDWSKLSPDKTSPEADVWFLETPDRNMLWTRHPNWAKPNLISSWNDKLRVLSLQT